MFKVKHLIAVSIACIVLHPVVLVNSKSSVSAENGTENFEPPKNVGEIQPKRNSDEIDFFSASLNLYQIPYEMESALNEAEFKEVFYSAVIDLIGTDPPIMLKSRNEEESYVQFYNGSDCTTAFIGKVIQVSLPKKCWQKDLVFVTLLNLTTDVNEGRYASHFPGLPQDDFVKNMARNVVLPKEEENSSDKCVDKADSCSSFVKIDGCARDPAYATEHCCALCRTYRREQKDLKAYAVKDENADLDDEVENNGVCIGGSRFCVNSTPFLAGMLVITVFVVTFVVVSSYRLGSKMDRTKDQEETEFGPDIKLSEAAQATRSVNNIETAESAIEV